MSLTSLRPKQPTDLGRLSHLLRVQNAKDAALPRALPEPLLLAVARDLRSMDQRDQLPETTVAAPLMLVLCILMGSPRPDGEVNISEAALYSSLRLYQWAVEREIVTRVTGIGGENDHTTLLTKLDELRMSESHT